MRRALMACALFLALGLAAGALSLVKWRALQGSAGPAWEPRETVETALVREAPFVPTAELVGTVLSLRSVLLSTERAGRIVAVQFDSGAVIEAGQVLVLLDATSDRADLAQATASVRVAQAEVRAAGARLGLARGELARLERVARAQAMAELDLDRARTEVERMEAEQDRARAALGQAEAVVAQVEARLDKLSIRAPFRARAGLRTVHEGQFLAEGAPIVQLEELSSRIYLDFAIPQDHAARAQPGTRVMARSALFGDEPFLIEVVAADAVVDRETRNLRVRAVVDDPGRRLRPGMFVRIKVPISEPEQLRFVPRTAVRHTPYDELVFVVQPGEQPGELRARQRSVVLGPTVGDEVAVLSGLEPGEEVVTTGAFKLMDGGLLTRAVGADAATVGSATGG